MLVGFWRAPFSEERLGKLSEVANALRADFDGPIGMLGVFESDSIQLAALADEGLRKHGARLQAEFATLFGAHQYVVLEGAGFAVAALRSAALALQAISRIGQRHVFCPDAATGISHLAAGLRLSPGQRTELALTVQQMREQTR